MEGSPLTVLDGMNDKLQLLGPATPKAYVHVQKIKVGICAAFIQLVGHFKRSLLLKHQKVTADDQIAPAEQRPALTSYEIVDRKLDQPDYF